PNFPEAYLNCALAHQQMGDTAEALEDYAAALRQNPNLPHAYVNRAEIYFAQGDYKAALTDYHQAHTLTAGYRQAVAGAGLCHFVLGDQAEARRLWAALLSYDPRFADAAWVIAEMAWPPPIADHLPALLAMLENS